MWLWNLIHRYLFALIKASLFSRIDFSQQKSYPLGNEHRMIACFETKIIFSMELVEGNDKPKKVIHAAPPFEEETLSKISALFLSMAKSIWGSDIGCVLDSGFGCT